MFRWINIFHSAGSRLTREISFKYLLIYIIRRPYSSYNHRTLSNILNSMPKQIDNKALRKSRFEQHVQSMEKNKPASQIYLQVIGNGAEGSSRCIYVFTDQWKYLFNCGEGTQRLANEYKSKLAKLDHIFFTHRSWNNFGGLPGLILTLQNIGIPKITFHGPEGIVKLFDISTGFLLSNNIEICEKNLADEEHIDNVMRVVYVPIYGGFRDNSHLLSESDVSLSGIEQIDDYCENTDGKRFRNITKFSDSSKPTKKCKMSNIEVNRDISVAYICQPTIKPGQLNLEKCLDFGVPAGPLLGQLKDGKDITLPNGVIVRSSEVVNPPDPCPVFIVLECPSEEFLESLLERPEFLKHQKDAENEDDVASVIIHFTPANVIHSEKYQQWLNRFSTTTQHLFLNEENDSLSSIAVHKIQHQLHLVNSDVFPLLKEKYQRIKDTLLNLDDRFIKTQTLLRYNLRPFSKIDTTRVVEADVESFVVDCLASPDFSAELTKLQVNRTTKENSIIQYPELLFLGTGSSIPSKVRNTSAILVHFSNDKSLLLDCSEGTYLQMYRFYGSDAVDDALLKIKAIYISHLHVDHHIGLIGILQKRRRAAIRRGVVFSPVALIAPQQINWWFQRYHEMFEPIIDDFRLIPNTGLLPGASNSPEYEAYEPIIQELDLKKVETVYARHCRHAFCVAFTHMNDWKIVYSGDTMPTTEILKIGQDCDLLIHEATMEDELISEALIKRHSTTSQAIEQGQKMNAKFTMLTHFSQRYAKIPRVTTALSNNVGIAFDNLKVSMADLKELPPLTPAVKALFAQEFEDMEIKTTKKLNQQAKQSGKPIYNFPHLNAT